MMIHFCAINRGYDVIVYKFIRLQPSTCKRKRSVYKNFHFGQRLRKYMFTSIVNAGYAWTGVNGNKNIRLEM